MPAIFIYAFVFFALVILLIMAFLIVFKGLRPTRHSSLSASSPMDWSWGTSSSGGGDSVLSSC